MTEDQTTTEAPVETTTGAEEPALPETTEQAAAATDDTSQQEVESPSEGEEQASLPEVDEDLQRYADSKGIKLTDANAIRAAKIAKDAQADFQRGRQRASQLEKSMTDAVDDYVDQQPQDGAGDSPEIARRLLRMEVKNSVRDFWDGNPEARQFESAMVEELKTRPHMAGDLEGLYAIVRTKNEATLKSDAGRQALETLASHQRAAAPSGAAVNPGVSSQPKITRQVMQQKLQSGDTAWLRQNEAEINRLVAEGKLQ